MLLRSIELRNFKAFRGEHKIDFPAPTKRSNVYLLGGENGAGKTTLVQAILLALYGVGALGMPGLPETGRDFRRRYEAWLEASRNVAARGNQDDLVTVAVLFDHNGQQIRIQRSFWYRADGHLDEELIEVREESSVGTELYAGDAAQERVAVWMPRHLAELIFFDGESVRAQLVDESGSISDALDRLLELEPVGKLLSDIRRLSRERRASLMSASQIDALESIERAVVGLEGSKRDLLLELGQASREASALEDKLVTVQRSLDDRLAGTAPLTSTQLAAQLKDLQLRRDELRTRLGRHLADWLYLALAPELVQDALTGVTDHRQARRLRERRKIEAEAADAFAEELLSELEATLPSRVHAIVSEVSESVRATRSASDDAADSSAASGALQNLHDDELALAEQAAESILGHDVDDVVYISRDLLTIQASIDELEELRGSLGSHGSLDRLVARMSELEGELATVRTRQESIEAALAVVVEDLAQRQRLLANLNAKAGDSARVTEWLAAADLLAQALNTYMTDRRRLAIADVEFALLAKLRDLLHKQQLVRAVEIDPLTYEVRLFGRSSRVVPLPSAGEHQLTAMAFAAAILECSDSALPMFVDTPLARLDAAHRTNVVSRFWPNTGRQVFVLSTDEEVHGDLLDALRPHVVQTYAVEHDENDMCSRVTPGAYFADSVSA